MTWPSPRKPPTTASSPEGAAAPRRPGRAAVLLALLAALLLPGCVFLRLSRGMVQLKYPEEAIAFYEEDGTLCGRLQEPVVLLSDVQAVLGRPPEDLGDRHVRYVFRKAGAEDRQPWETHFWTDEQGRIARFAVPRLLYKVAGRELIVDGLRALGWSNVSAARRTLYLELTLPVTMRQLDELMGAPTSSSAGSRAWVFGYQGRTLSVSAEGGTVLRRGVITAGSYTIEVTGAPEGEDD